MSNISYSWNFNPLEIVYNNEGMTDVIETVHWQYIATLPTGTDPIQQQIIGSIKLQSPSVEGFIPFTNVTKETVTAWVVAELGNEKIVEIETNLSKSIAVIASPINGIVPPPWEN